MGQNLTVSSCVLVLNYWTFNDNCKNTLYGLKDRCPLILWIVGLSPPSVAFECCLCRFFSSAKSNGELLVIVINCVFVYDWTVIYYCSVYSTDRPTNVHMYLIASTIHRQLGLDTAADLQNCPVTRPCSNLPTWPARVYRPTCLYVHSAAVYRPTDLCLQIRELCEGNDWNCTKGLCIRPNAVYMIAGYNTNKPDYVYKL